MLFWYYLPLFWHMLMWFDVNLINVDIIFIFEEADSYHARRGAGTSIFGAYCSKNLHFPYLQHSSGLGNSTPWSASSRRCDHTNSHQNPAYVALFREKSLFSMVYRGATASGTVSRVPGRSTCIGHTKDELRRASDGRVMIIWMLAELAGWVAGPAGARTRRRRNKQTKKNLWPAPLPPPSRAQGVSWRRSGSPPHSDI